MGDIMTTTSVEARTGFVSVGDAELWFEQRGEGPDVLLLAGLSDPVESWTFQLEGLADRYRVTAFDNRGAGRSPMPPDGFTVQGMADDAAGVLRGARHRAGPRHGILRRQRHRPGAGLAPPRSRQQPRADQHVGPPGRLPAHGDGGLDVAARGCSQRAEDARGVSALDLHAARPRGGDGRADHRGGHGPSRILSRPRGSAASSTRGRSTTRSIDCQGSTFRPSSSPARST